MKKCIFICLTSYQIICAIQLKLTEYTNQKTDFIISESLLTAIPNIDNALKNVGLADDVFIIKGSYDFGIGGVKNKILEKIRLRRIIDSALWERNKYSCCLFANVGGVSPKIVRYLNRRNSSLNISMYEDGISSYSHIYANSINYRIHNNSFIRRVCYRLSNNIFRTITNYYVFKPELLTWTVPFIVKQIAPIDKNNCRTVEIFNKVFNVDNTLLNIEEELIFFEESYDADGIEIGDFELVGQIIEKFGQDNVIIKQHPRSLGSRFDNKGYKLLAMKSIPWEIIAINIDVDKKKLVTISSTAVLNTFILFGSCAKIVFLFGMLEINNERFKHTIEVIEKAHQLYPNDILVEGRRH